jgi:hypothetical protein
MERYYKAKIRLHDGEGSCVIVFLAKSLGGEWTHQLSKYCTGFDRAQEVAEQFRLSHNIAEHAFELSIDTRSHTNDPYYI